VISREADDFPCLLIWQPRLTHSDFPIERLSSFWFVLAGDFLASPELHCKRQSAASCSFKMISFSNINKQYGKQLLFVDALFQLNPGEKVGLVGPNGAGETTLFHMVVGEESPDDGTVSVPKKLTIGYFRQDVEEMQPFVLD